MSERIFCEVYKSLRDEEMYLYLSKSGDMESIPETLKVRFNLEKPVTSFVLTEDKKLARAKAATVIAAIKEKGFYLQMPPPKLPIGDVAMEQVAAHNEKLSR